MFRTAYGPKDRVSLSFPEDEGRTRQEFKADCDVNRIMARFVKTNVIDFTSRYAPRYGDCTGLDFQAAMDKVVAAQGMFQAMPASLRDRFGNNPRLFLDFINNPDNRDEAEKLGLLKRAAPVLEPVAVRVVEPAQPAKPAAPAA